MRERTKEFIRGDRILAAVGHYSDWTAIADLLALKDFTLGQVIAAYRDTLPLTVKNPKPHFSASPFILWLIKNGYVKELEPPHEVKEMFLDNEYPKAWPEV